MIKLINVTYTDYLNFVKFACQRLSKSEQSRSKIFFKNMVIWFILSMFLMTLFQLKAIDFSGFHWPSALIPTLFFLIFIMAYLFNLKKLRGLMTPKQNGPMIGAKKLSLNEEGIYEENALGHSYYQWQAVESIEENKGDIYIFVDTVLALIIPTQTFESAIEKEEFISFVKTNIG